MRQYQRIHRDGAARWKNRKTVFRSPQEWGRSPRSGTSGANTQKVPLARIDGERDEAPPPIGLRGVGLKLAVKLVAVHLEILERRAVKFAKHIGGGQGDRVPIKTQIVAAGLGSTLRVEDDRNS